MVGDVLREREHLFLGSRLKRLAERMQSEVARVAQEAGLAIQPGQYALLATLDRYGPQTVGTLTRAMGLSQPAVTRTIGKLVKTGLIEMTRAGADQRLKSITLTAEGEAAIARSKLLVWPRIEAAVEGLLGNLPGRMLADLTAIEDRLAETPLGQRAAEAPAPSLSIRDYEDSIAGDFHRINAEWIEAMYRLEETDRIVLENPRREIIDRGGVILFVEAAGLGIVGACALQKTGPDQYELTKMGVLAKARNLKAGEFLLKAVIARAAAMGVRRLYLLSNKKSAAAIHLYEKLGFAHDAGIMAEFGARYSRCDVAMLYRPQVG